METTNAPVLIVFGAGAGLGAAVARRFGAEGFRVGLVARDLARLGILVDELAANGVDAHAFAADLSDPAVVPGLIGDIRTRFGRVDVVEYSPLDAGQGFTAATQLDARTVERLGRLFLLTPIEIAHAVLPEMIERGSGAILVTHGHTAAEAMPFLSGPGVVMAATRNYLQSLNAELEGSGVYAGMLSIAALIDSNAAPAAADGPAASSAGALAGSIPRVHPDVLAERHWSLYTRRDRVEQFYPG